VGILTFELKLKIILAKKTRMFKALQWRCLFLYPKFKTRNGCYTANRKIASKGIMIHSTATPGVMAGAWLSRWNKSFRTGEIIIVNVVLCYNFHSMNLRLGYLFCGNSIIPKPDGFMLFYCQLLLNFQGSYTDFHVRSFS
jgi:hypothetical protein